MLRIAIPLIVLSLAALSYGAVIGIDFGSEYFKVSMIAPGKSFVIVENMASKRKTNNAISFANNQRWYESNAMTKRLKFPQNTFVFTKKFLGALSNDEEVFKISRKYYEAYKI
jgi:hypoxia up-regulated 1